jgi:hypothetical protein
MTSDPTIKPTIRERERAENAPYIAEARRTGRAITFIASDGCAVTAMPDGNVLFNAADWF